MAFHHSPRIVQDGLVFYMDPANAKGYVSGNTTGTDLIQDASYTLVNAVDYQSNNYFYRRSATLTQKDSSFNKNDLLFLCLIQYLE